MRQEQLATPRQTVMIVDDSAIVRKLARSILRGVDVSIIECDNGAAAIAACEQVLPSLILLDVMMPGINGIEVCTTLRARYGRDELPIIMVTALSDGVDLASGLSAGANDYVTKPIDRRELLARVKTQLELGAARAALEAQRRRLAETLSIQRAVEDSLPQAIVVQNRDGSVVYANRLAIEWNNGVVPATMTDLWRSFRDGMVLSFGVEHVKALQSQPELCIDDEFEIGVAEKVYLEVYSHHILGSGEPPLRLWVWRDVTRVRRLESMVAQQRRLDTVELFAHGVAHNLNNILGGVAGATEILQRIVPREERRAERCLSVLRRSVESGRRLTSKMLWPLPKGSADEGAPSIGTLVQQACDIQQALCVGKQIDVVLSLLNQELQLPMPQVALVHVISNVLSNAFDAIDGTGRVEIRGEADSFAGVYTLTIRDSGCGMSPEMVSRVFEPFFTTKSLDERHGISTVGNGLGLWSVYHLLKSAGGEIEISSAVSVGTEVSISLPMNKEVAERVKARSASGATRADTQLNRLC